MVAAYKDAFKPGSSKWWSLNHPFGNFLDSITSWLIVMNISFTDDDRYILIVNTAFLYHRMWPTTCNLDISLGCTQMRNTKGCHMCSRINTGFWWGLFCSVFSMLGFVNCGPLFVFATVVFHLWVWLFLWDLLSLLYGWLLMIDKG